MKNSFKKRIKIKKKVLLKKQKGTKHLLTKKSSSRKRRLHRITYYSYTKFY